MQRREFLKRFGLGILGTTLFGSEMGDPMADKAKQKVRIFLCGDVMPGRGIDQVLPNPSRPNLYEPYVRDANVYVEIAERVNGPILRPVSNDYIWGDALDELRSMAPDLRLINLETAVTTSEAYWRGKGINYRMHPANIPCLGAADIDGCVLANNHVLDWGEDGLVETLDTLSNAGIFTVGAGRNLREAVTPAVFELPGGGRVLLYAIAHPSSGAFEEWRATVERPGINLLAELSVRSVGEMARQVAAEKREGDLAVLSIHWGGNWGYEIPVEQQRFAHQLIDEAGIDVIWGHSSHHPKGIEVYRGRPILYGCGDLLNDYEGIGGKEAYRGDLSLMYFLTLDPATGELVNLQMAPMIIGRFQLQRPSASDYEWLQQNLSGQYGTLGTGVTEIGERRFELIFQ
ncbi:MAG: CapA family protein [Sedimenticola sp.]